MDPISKRLNRLAMKASGMSDEAINEAEEQQEEMERSYKKGGPTAAQDAYFKRMEKSMEDAFKGINEAPEMSVADELGKLAKLREQGVISESEFQQMKKDLMKKMS